MGNMQEALMPRLIDAMARAVVTKADLLGDLDRAIGDGDHGLNMVRGFTAVADKRSELAELPLGAALEAMGRVLVMTVGGASGPLYGSLFIAMGGACARADSLAAMIDEGVAAVRRRGKSDRGAKTMLDVLVPVQIALHEATAERLALSETLDRVRLAARAGLEATRPLAASKGRAAFLRERSIGHLDPGACSSALLVEAVCDVFAESGKP